MSPTELPQKIESLARDIRLHLSTGYRLSDPALTLESAMSQLSQRIHKCQKCVLHRSRTQAVPGVGVLHPLVLVVGEAPGADEDKKGEPFIGKSGQYLDKWLASIDLDRKKNVYITNIIKCRPPNNRDPALEEKSACADYLDHQVRLLQPKFILCAGKVAAQHLLKSQEPLRHMRQKVQEFAGIPLVVTYHPSGVLRNLSLRKSVWEDLKLLRSLMNDR